MKAVSLLPAATDMIRALGLEDRLYAVTHECALSRPRAVRSVLADDALGSGEINRLVGEYVRQGKKMYELDRELLENIQPDVIFTQQLCHVCQIGQADVEAVVAEWENKPRVISLSPGTLDDVIGQIPRIAVALGEPRKGLELAESCRTRLDSLRKRLKTAGRGVRRVLFLEWTDPLMACGHWIPEQIRLAGGEDGLSCPGSRSRPLSCKDIREYDPEMIVIAPCGFRVERTMKEAEKLKDIPEWRELTAVRQGMVYAAPGDLFTQPSLSLITGTELLAYLFHPDLFQAPGGVEWATVRG